MDAERGALARLGGDADTSADGGGFALDHVHADTATGQAGQACGGETGNEDQVGEALVVGVLVGGYQAGFDGVGADAREVEASAVVAELDHHVVAFVGHLEGDLAEFGLAGCAPDFRRLDAVGDRVTDQVAERAGHHFEDAAVDFDLPADDVEVGAAAEFLGGLADQAVQPLGKAVERHHAHVHQRLLELAGHA